MLILFEQIVIKKDDRSGLVDVSFKMGSLLSDPVASSGVVSGGDRNDTEYGGVEERLE